MRESSVGKAAFDKKIIKQLLLSSFFGVILFLVLSCLFSIVRMKNSAFSDKMFVFSLSALVVSSLLCGFLSAKRNKLKGVISGSISGFLMCAGIYLITAAASGFSFSYKAIIILPAVIISSVIGAILKKNIERSRRKSMKKKSMRIKRFNGKLLKSNQTLTILCVLLLTGMFLSAVCVKHADEAVLEKIKALTGAYFVTGNESSIIKNFLSYISADTQFIILSVLFGLCVIGEPILWLLPVIRGLGLGIITGYIYKTFNVQGVIYSTVLIVVPAVISSLAMAVSCKESILSSRDIRSTLKQDGKQFNYREFIKLFAVRNLILYVFVILSGIIGCILTYFFSSKIIPLS